MHRTTFTADNFGLAQSVNEAVERANLARRLLEPTPPCRSVSRGRT
jgi:hypothetical protein